MESPSDRITRLENALRGIASCSTSCKCCEMHRQIAQEALAPVPESVRAEAHKYNKRPTKIGTCSI